MKVCMVLEFFVPHYNGGGEHRYFEIAKRLVERGHHVDVLTMKLVDVPNYEKISGINVHHIGGVVENPPFRSTFNFIKYFFSVIRWLNNHDYDVVDAQAYSPLLSARLSSIFKKTPLIGTIHDTSSNANDQWQQSSALASSMEKYLVNLNFDKIITVSHATFNSLVNDFGVTSEKIEILYNGVDLPKYDSVKLDSTYLNQIVFVGRLSPHKHVDHLINAVNEIKKSIPTIKLVIVGKGEEKKNLLELTNKLNLNDSIVFQQDLTDEELIKTIKESEILVLPSTREGFGMVLAEANACYKPVITYASGGTVEVVEDGYNGYLINNYDNSILTNKLEELLKNKKLQKELGLNGRKKVESEFNWEKIVDEYLKILNSTIEI